jgi:tRNA-splicing ligase RtcB
MEMDQFPALLPGGKADTLMWANPWEIEDAALAQLRRISELPWVEKLRVMPDVHLGKGATVGSVIAMRGAVSPAAVGVDLGCGMGAVRTSLTLEDLPDDLKPLRTAIEAAIPVGFRGHSDTAPILKRDQSLTKLFTAMATAFDQLHADRIAERRGKALSQCGTLGGGNHFIELCADADSRIWITLHSGSRNIGKEIAERHIGIAKKLEHNQRLPDRDLAVFLAGTPEMEAYRWDLYWAQDYAWLSRQIMLAILQNLLRDQFAPISFDEPVLCHHNYVAEESYDGVDLFVTRKGAIRAMRGDLGLIPGSMATGSYVVRGLGNERSLCSASHGAGRRMSRTAAKQRYTTADLEKQTAGVECRKDAGVIDEIPGAYKDIHHVINAQSDLVEVVARLETLLCVKG